MQNNKFYRQEKKFRFDMGNDLKEHFKFIKSNRIIISNQQQKLNKNKYNNKFLINDFYLTCKTF